MSLNRHWRVNEILKDSKMEVVNTIFLTAPQQQSNHGAAKRYHLNIISRISRLLPSVATVTNYKAVKHKWRLKFRLCIFEPWFCRPLRGKRIRGVYMLWMHPQQSLHDVVIFRRQGRWTLHSKRESVTNARQCTWLQQVCEQNGLKSSALSHHLSVAKRNITEL